MSLQKSVDANEDQDYSWYMMEFAGRIPVFGGRMDFSLNGAIMALEDEDGLGGVGAMLGLGPKVELLQDILAIEVPARVMFAGEATFESTHFYSPEPSCRCPCLDWLRSTYRTRDTITWRKPTSLPTRFRRGWPSAARAATYSVLKSESWFFPEGHDVLQFGIGFTPESSAKVDSGKLEPQTPN